jgi:uncharacterized GH25 family protein
MLHRSALVFIAATCLSGAAVAHDLWVQPRLFAFAPAQKVPVDILIGHGPSREDWGIRLDRLVLLKAISPSGKSSDLLPAARATKAFMLNIAERGTHIIAMQSNNAESTLPAARYNEFAVEEGLSTIIAHRTATGTMAKPGRELYSRRAKSIVQVGAVSVQTSLSVTKPVGFDLEIIPERHPYLLGRGEKLPVLVTFRGRPLRGALVKLTNLDADAKPVAMLRTNGQGRAAFAVPAKGKWLLNVVWSTPVAGESNLYTTVFSSLTFGDRP